VAIDWDKTVLGPVHAAFSTGEDQPVFVSWGGGAWYPIADAVFDLTHIEVGADGRAPSSSFHPTLGIRQSSLPPGVRLQQGDGVQVGDRFYAVVDVQPDNLGHVLLILGAT